MTITTSYGIQIKGSEYNKALKDTGAIYRRAVMFFINVCDKEWDYLDTLEYRKVNNAVEKLTIRTKDRPEPKYCFEDAEKAFYKFPAYLRRSAISKAIGLVSSYRSNLINWEKADEKTRGKRPKLPKEIRNMMPTMYRKASYKRTGLFSTEIKVYVRNTWDFIEIPLDHSDVKYIEKHCQGRIESAPTIERKGKRWYLRFAYEEICSLCDIKDIEQVTILAVDLGINSACTCCVMRSDGTILSRHSLKLTKEEDSLSHAVNKIKKVQRNGAKRCPSYWAAANGINDDISVKTANFIVDTAKAEGVQVIVMEYLDFKGKKKRKGKKQRLHLWKSSYVQSMVTVKAHRAGIHMSHVCARDTSSLAYDGSGKVQRGKDAGLPGYSLCKFQTGKIYNCDLSASYNIGARYYIREILKPEPERVRLQLQAKVPATCKRSTCTLADLISLNAELASMMASSF